MDNRDAYKLRGGCRCVETLQQRTEMCSNISYLNGIEPGEELHHALPRLAVGGHSEGRDGCFARKGLESRVQDEEEGDAVHCRVEDLKTNEFLPPKNGEKGGEQGLCNHFDSKAYIKEVLLATDIRNLSCGDLANVGEVTLNLFVVSGGGELCDIVRGEVEKN